MKKKELSKKASSKKSKATFRNEIKWCGWWLVGGSGGARRRRGGEGQGGGSSSNASQLSLRGIAIPFCRHICILPIIDSGRVEAGEGD